MATWQVSPDNEDDRCPVCGALLEWLVDGEYYYGERCPVDRRHCYRRDDDAPEES